VRFEFSPDGSACTALLGATRARASVTAALEAPAGGRAAEGVLRVEVELSPMASPAHETGGRPEAATRLALLLERGLRRARALDLEALCVAPGRAAWTLRLEVRLLDAGGNAADAAGLAALGALLAFRRPEAALDAASGAVVVAPTAEREPLPLTLHHLPLPITYALFDRGATFAADPTLAEEAAADGGVTIVANPHGEICGVSSARGCGLAPAAVRRALRLAAARAGELAAALQAALKGHEAARAAARVRRAPAEAAAAAAAAAAGGTDGRSALVLRSGELLGAPAPSGAAADTELPEAVRAAVAHAAAPDSSDDGAEEEAAAAAASSSESESEGEAVGAPMDKSEAVAPAAAAPAAAPRPKRRRPSAAAAAGGGDDLAAVADIMAGRSLAGGDDLAAAVRRVPG
jgi:exosome complex RNA-binding protein Rrp42 (RNase PH superfamily)